MTQIARAGEFSIGGPAKLLRSNIVPDREVPKFRPSNYGLIDEKPIPSLTTFD